MRVFQLRSLNPTPECTLAGAKPHPSLVLRGGGAPMALWGAQQHLWTLLDVGCRPHPRRDDRLWTWPGGPWRRVVVTQGCLAPISVCTSPPHGCSLLPHPAVLQINAALIVRGKNLWDLLQFITKAGVPNPQAIDGHQSTACWEPGCTAEAERWVDERAKLHLPPITHVTA